MLLNADHTAIRDMDRLNVLQSQLIAGGAKGRGRPEHRHASTRWSQADSKLARLKKMEQRGDMDWRRVKEVHDSFKYSHSGSAVRRI